MAAVAPKSYADIVTYIPSGPSGTGWLKYDAFCSLDTVEKVWTFFQDEEMSKYYEGQFTNKKGNFKPSLFEINIKLVMLSEMASAQSGLLVESLEKVSIRNEKNLSPSVLETLKKIVAFLNSPRGTELKPVNPKTMDQAAEEREKTLDHLHDHIFFMTDQFGGKIANAEAFIKGFCIFQWTASEISALKNRQRCGDAYRAALPSKQL